MLKLKPKQNEDRGFTQEKPKKQAASCNNSKVCGSTGSNYFALMSTMFTFFTVHLFDPSCVA